MHSKMTLIPEPSHKTIMTQSRKRCRSLHRHSRPRRLVAKENTVTAITIDDGDSCISKALNPEAFEQDSMAQASVYAPRRLIIGPRRIEAEQGSSAGYDAVTLKERQLPCYEARKACRMVRPRPFSLASTCHETTLTLTELHCLPDPPLSSQRQSECTLYEVTIRSSSSSPALHFSCLNYC